MRLPVLLAIHQPAAARQHGQPCQAAI